MRNLWSDLQWYWFDRRMKKQWKKMVEDCKPVECPPETDMTIFAEPFTKIIDKGCISRNYIDDVIYPPCTCGEESCPDAKR